MLPTVGTVDLGGLESGVTDPSYDTTCEVTSLLCSVELHVNMITYLRNL